MLQCGGPGGDVPNPVSLQSRIQLQSAKWGYVERGAEITEQHSYIHGVIS